jgi:hypothetical protein
MEIDVKTPSLVYEVCFGALFKMRHEGRKVTALSKRNREGNWLPAYEIEDYPSVYKDLADDQFAIVQVESKDDVVRIREIFTAQLLGDGDTATIGQAIRQKKLGGILEKSFKDWEKKSGPLLMHAPGTEHDGQPSILWPSDLVAKYDLKDIPALLLAFEHESREGVDADRMKFIDEAVAKFKAFLDEIEPEEDELYWFEHLAIMADRIGYVIIRNGRTWKTYIVMMS